MFPYDIPDELDRIINCDFIIDGSFGVFTKLGKVAAENCLLVREPYLDNSLIDFITRLPRKYKVGGNLWRRLKGKAITKNLVRRDLVQSHLPGEAVSKPKTGFAPPTKWLKEYLEHSKFPVESLISPALRQAKYFDTSYVNKIIDDYLEKPYIDRPLPYMLVSFVVWHRLYIEDFKVSTPTVTLTELLKS